MYKYLFGPIPSRRLGTSLGIDLVPSKVCSLDCVYCEAGKTTNLSLKRREYVSFDKVKKELEHYFDNNVDPDYFTFSGSGEPTLNSKIGDIIDFLKKEKPNVKIAVITNSTTLILPDVRKSLLKADLVLPSLDAVNEGSFKKINRPVAGFTASDCIKGIIDFKKDFKGEIWLEVFILEGYNDDEDNLLKLKQAVSDINPNLLQINTLDRPGTIEELKPASNDVLRKVVGIIDFPNTKIITSSFKTENTNNNIKDIKNTILETILRRPCTENDLAKITGVSNTQISKHINMLLAEGKIKSIRKTRGVFYFR